MKYNLNLMKNALWIVMDPWRVQTTLGKQDDYTREQDYINEYFAGLIAWKLDTARHKVISLPHYDRRDDENAISPYFDGYMQLHTPESVVDYCNKHNINSIVYTGFHVGKCILRNSTGAINMKSLGFKTYMAVDLSCVLKNTTTNRYPFGQMIERTMEHCQLI